MNNFSRRIILKGAGAALSLPFLESFGANKKHKGLDKAPLRFIPLFMPNGAHPSCWDIKEHKGADYQLSKALKPLEKVKSEIIPISNLEHFGVNKNHEPMMPTILTSDGTSIDQLLAAEIGQDTRYASMNLGIEPPKGGSTYNQCSPFFKNKAVIVPEINPQVIFDRLFNSALKKNVKRYKSILDIVHKEIKSMQNKVSKGDRHKIDEYITSVRQVERSIEKTLNPNDEKCWESPTWNKSKIIQRPDAIPPLNKNDHMNLIIDLIILAIWTDQSRIISLTMGHDFGGDGFTFLPGVNMSHHQASHTEIKQYNTITKWHIEKFALLLSKMQSINEGSGSLLDNSLLYFGSCMKEGGIHSSENLPIILAGGACGKLKTGSHLKLKEKTRHNNLLASLLIIMGTKHKKFGNSNGYVELPS